MNTAGLPPFANDFGGLDSLGNSEHIASIIFEMSGSAVAVVETWVSISKAMEDAG